MSVLYDEKFKFTTVFDSKSGLYIRSDSQLTGKDPFMASFPHLLDVGIMGRCFCANGCNVDCYQKAYPIGINMSVTDFQSILDQCSGKCFQFALGGKGDPDTHESFEKILKLCCKYDIVPNFTTSGILMTPKKAKLCAKYCGAIAVSEHFHSYTNDAVKMLLDAGVKTNIHFVLSRKTIKQAINILRNHIYDSGINAVVFLLYKPIGFGQKENVLSADDEDLNKFFALIDNNDYSFKIGFDSCTVPGLINFTHNIETNSLDYCEGARFSAYIDADMNMMPCSFANQNKNYYVSLRTHTIEEAWNSNVFNQFRASLQNSCPDCPDRESCGGGCPIVNSVTLCNRKERVHCNINFNL